MPAALPIAIGAGVVSAVGNAISGNAAKTQASRTAGRQEQIGALNREARYEDAQTVEMIMNENARRTRVDAQNYARIHELNQKALEENEAAVEAATAFQLENIDVNARRFMSEQVVAYSGAGVDIAAGSPITTLMESKKITERNIGALRQQSLAELSKIHSEQQIEKEQAQQQIQNLNDEANFILMQGTAQAKALRKQGDIEYETALAQADQTRGEGVAAMYGGIANAIGDVGSIAKLLIK